MKKEGEQEIDVVKPTQSMRRLVVLLFLVFLIILVLRFTFGGVSQSTVDDKLWRLTINLTVKTEANHTAVQIYPPYDTAQLHVVQRNLRHVGFRIRNWNEEKTRHRSILAFATEDGLPTFSSEFYILQSSNVVEREEKKEALTTEQRERYLQDSDAFQLQDKLLNSTLVKIINGQTEQSSQVNAIFNYAKSLTKVRMQNVQHVPTTIASKKSSQMDRSLTMVALCRAANIPARIVTGVIIKEDIESEPYYWVQAHYNGQWWAFDPLAGYQESVPINYLPLRYNDIDITKVLNGETRSLVLNLDRDYEHPSLKKTSNRSLFSIFDLNYLPLDSRLELSLLLLLPLGVLVTAGCRHLIGLHSYGVFTPTLLALALVYADKLITAITFLVICSLAIAGRKIFPSTISRIPRLAIIFTLIASIMAFSVSVLVYLDIGQTGNVVLLPIIILTSMVDRLYRTIEENGFQIAMHRLVWTILITLVCVPVIQFESLGNLIVTHPEIHFVSLALFLLIAMYKGRQVMSLPIFSVFAEPKSPGKKKKKLSKKLLSEQDD